VLCLSIFSSAVAQSCSPRASYSSLGDTTYYCDDGSGNLSINNNYCSCGGNQCASCADSETSSCTCSGCPTLTTSSGGYFYTNLTGLNPYQTIQGSLKVSPGSSSFSIFWLTESNFKRYQSGNTYTYFLSGSNPNQIHCYNNPSVLITPQENLYIIYQCRNSFRSCNLQYSYTVKDASGNTFNEYGFTRAPTPAPAPTSTPTPNGPTLYISAGRYTISSVSAQCPSGFFDTGYTVTSTGTDSFSFQADHAGFYGGTIRRTNSTTFLLTSGSGSSCSVSATSGGQYVNCGSGCWAVWTTGSTPTPNGPGVVPTVNSSAVVVVSLLAAIVCFLFL